MQIVLNDFYLYFFFFINFYVVTSNYIYICAYTIIAILKSLCLEFLEIEPEILKLLRTVAERQWLFSVFYFGLDQVCFAFWYVLLTYFLLLRIWDGLFAYFARKWMLQCCFKLLLILPCLTQFRCQAMIPLFYSPNVLLLFFTLSQGSFSRIQILL